MGRLRKSVVDKIVKLREENYTQAETAEKLHIHIKSVQKYDPLRRSADERTARSPETLSSRDLVAILKTQGDFIDAILITLRLDTQARRVRCPSCLEGDLEEENGVYTCLRCGYKMRMFANVWNRD